MADTHDDAQNVHDSSIEEAPAQESIDWKKKSREWETRSKENHKKVGALEEHVTTLTRERDELTALVETLTSEKEALTSERDSLALKASTFEIGYHSGVDPALLKGTTREEIEAHAKQLQAWKNTASTPNAPRMGYQPDTHDLSPERDFLRKLFKKEG